ncbi:hypothetical protein WA026_011408 [Henosepilachna vigintioctopunctata]|uniref:Uncharacterized protein n=1 Tax=Henosepilachna vigintioctopunctata TaxID=420089 RepID=A0AAW1TVD5_9CUCU
MWSVILFLVFTWILQQGCISIGDLEDVIPDPNFSTKLRRLLPRHSKYSGGGSGFVPETPSSEKHLNYGHSWEKWSET